MYGTLHCRDMNSCKVEIRNKAKRKDNHVNNIGKSQGKKRWRQMIIRRLDRYTCSLTRLCALRRVVKAPKYRSGWCRSDAVCLTVMGDLAILRWHKHPDVSSGLATLSLSRFLTREISHRVPRFRASKKAPPYEECSPYRRADDGRIVVLTTYIDDIITTGDSAIYCWDHGVPNKLVGELVWRWLRKELF